MVFGIELIGIDQVGAYSDEWCLRHQATASPANIKYFHASFMMDCSVTRHRSIVPTSILLREIHFSYIYARVR